MYKWTANDRKNGSPGSRFHQPPWSRRKRRPSSNHTGKDMSFQCCLGHWWYGRSSDRHLELYEGLWLYTASFWMPFKWCVGQRVCSSPICYFCYLGPHKGRGLCKCPSRCCRTFTYSCSLVLIMCVHADDVPCTLNCVFKESPSFLKVFLLKTWDQSLHFLLILQTRQTISFAPERAKKTSPKAPHSSISITAGRPVSSTMTSSWPLFCWKKRVGSWLEDW